MMDDLLEDLKKGKIILLDGATGTELNKRGLEFGLETTLAHEKHFMKVIDIAEEYALAGSEIVLTNTFGASRTSLDRYGEGERTDEINFSATDIMIGVPFIYLAGSVGPSTGEFNYGMEGYGQSADDFYKVFTEQISALKRGRVDLIALETFMCYEEAEQALRASKDLEMVTAVSFSFNYEQNNDKYATMYGADINKLVGLKDADIVGFNCGDVTLEQSVELTRRIRDNTDKPIWVKPNGGPPAEPEKCSTPEQFAEYGERIIEAGAKLIGGCCLTTPQHIYALNTVIERYNGPE
jgi:5-methyltetrahydrofolate--homocysteine methyltransferase|tara:strand:+ start:67 stop:951 length:885 start_codon:yes stop_codon:yes gene_type:complete